MSHKCPCFLQYFTPDQLENFSAAQAQSTTTAQRSHLNYNQFTKLEASGDITWESERPGNYTGISQGR